MRNGEANVVALARRLLATQPDQPGLLADRMNDLSVALWELDNGVHLPRVEPVLRLNFPHRDDCAMWTADPAECTCGASHGYPNG